MTGLSERWRRVRAGGDAGNAMLEFVGLSVLLLLPLVYLLLTVFQLQRAAFGVTQAAREAGRAYATAPTSGDAPGRAELAARLAMADQGVDGNSLRVSYACLAGCAAGGVPTLLHGSRFRVTVAMDVALPYAGHGRFAGRIPAAVPVSGSYEVAVDTLRVDR